MYNNKLDIQSSIFLGFQFIGLAINWALFFQSQGETEIANFKKNDITYC